MIEVIGTIKNDNYKCGSCDHEFQREWDGIEFWEDISTCPCDQCGAMATLAPKPYHIFRGMDPVDEFLIGNLLLDTIEAIHGKSIIRIDHNKRQVFVKQSFRSDLALKRLETSTLDDWRLEAAAVLDDWSAIKLNLLK